MLRQVNFSAVMDHRSALHNNITASIGCYFDKRQPTGRRIVSIVVYEYEGPPRPAGSATDISQSEVHLFVDGDGGAVETACGVWLLCKRNLRASSRVSAHTKQMILPHNSGPRAWCFTLCKTKRHFVRLFNSEECPSYHSSSGF